MDDSNTDASEESFFVPGFKDAASFSQHVLRSVLGTTKASNELPSAGDDHDYYSTFSGFQSFISKEGQTILSLMTALIQSHGIREKFQGRELEEKFDLLVDVNDLILENVSNYLDEASGQNKSDGNLVVAVKPPTAINTSWNKKQFNITSPQSCRLLTAKNISRPQLTFKDKIDNSNSIFVPIIKDKPNSIRPLAVTLEKYEDKEVFCHPYELEIEKFQPSDDQLQEVDLVFSKPLDETPYEFVSTEEQLKVLCEELKKEKEIAVDLEHHSYRSFQGFTCLMQLSTRSKDYIVDVLKLRSEMQVLNEVFTDSKIVKVLHGADMDVLWLQRDFGVYIVNLFDTGQAARVLQFAHLSLSYLLKHYCKLNVDKKFQLADWRIRPLPAEMIKYAREDTHYLLYVYDCLKNDLIKQGNEMKNLLHSTIDRSKLICLKRYQKPLFSDDKYMDQYRKSRKMFNAKQLYCLKEMFSWRDQIAREYDESPLYVLPNHMLLQIAEALPREQQGILACCNPIPPIVKQQLNELHSIILKANGFSIKELEALEYHQKAQLPKINDIDLSSFIDCPHDILHLEDKNVHTTASISSGNVLPQLSKNHLEGSLIKLKPSLSALFAKDAQEPKIENADVNDRTIPQIVIEHIQKLTSPFERFKMTTEFHASQKKENKEVVELKNEESQDGIQESSVDNNKTIEISDEEIVEEQPNVSENPVMNTSCEISESGPIRKKRPRPHFRKNRKRAKKASQEVVSEPPKMDTSCEIVKCSPVSKKKSKPYFGKNRKHAKQATFNRGGKGSNCGASSQWPKNI